MADWFTDTNAATAYAETGTTRTVLHGQAAKGQPLARDSFIIAASKRPHEDVCDFFHSADDAALLDLNQSFADLFNSLAARDDFMWLINVIKNQDARENDTNSQIPYLHVHVLSGPLTERNRHITAERTFHPHPSKKIYQTFREAREAYPFYPEGHGVKLYDVPHHAKEARLHYAVTQEGYKDFPTFVQNATRAEKLALWRSVSRVALRLATDYHGARIGCYNMPGPGGRSSDTGGVFIEITGGENLGQSGQKHRWFEQPKKFRNSL